MTKPNWENLTDYDYTTVLNSEEWAWEFLRRDPDFQKDCQHLKDGTLKDNYGNLPVSFTKIIPTPHGKFFLSPPLSDGQTVQQWVKEQLANKDHIPVKVPKNYLRQKWGLKSTVFEPNLDAIEIREYLAGCASSKHLRPR